jgi:ribA/ribD-fused uncharacterized protein
MQSDQRIEPNPLKITSFTGEHAFLSNFYPCSIAYDNWMYPSVEHAYQAAKTFDTNQRERIRVAGTPGRAKQLGRKVTMRAEWNTVKLETMRMLLERKFAFNPLRRMLKDTGTRELIEVNWWGDTYWGKCKGVGENNLGKLLMEIRESL